MLFKCRGFKDIKYGIPMCHEGHKDISAYRHFSTILIISLHYLYFSVFLCISLHFSTFIFISQHLSAFLCVSLHFSTFHCISLHFTAFLCISLHFSPFFCILHFIFSSYGSHFFPWIRGAELQKVI